MDKNSPKAIYKKKNIGYNKLQGVDSILQWVFADDEVIIAKSENELQNNLEIWNRISEYNEMVINKAKVMLIGK